MKKTVTILLLGLFGATFLFGCAGKEDPANNAVPPAGGNARPDAMKKDPSKGPGAAQPNMGLAHP